LFLHASGGTNGAFTNQESENLNYIDTEVFADMDIAVVLRSLRGVGDFISKVPDLIGKEHPVSFTTRPTADIFGY